MQQDFNVEIQSCKLRFIQVFLVKNGLAIRAAMQKLGSSFGSIATLANEFNHQLVDVSLCQGLGSHETPSILGTEFKRVNEECAFI